MCLAADLERNIFRVSLAERRADLERLPWVEHATVMRLLPNILRVQITERTPVAFVRQGSQIGLVDASGVLLDMPADAPGDPHYSFPVLTGLSADEAISERAAKMAIYEQFMHDLDGSGQHLSDAVSEVDVSDPEDVKALITSGSSDILVHFGEEQFLQRYQEFQEHLAEWKQQYPKLASADMRYEGQIVLEMQGDADAATIGTGTAESAGAAPVAAKPVAEAKPVAVKPAAPKPVFSGAAATPVVPKPACDDDCCVDAADAEARLLECCDAQACDAEARVIERGRAEACGCAEGDGEGESAGCEEGGGEAGGWKAEAGVGDERGE